MGDVIGVEISLRGLGGMIRSFVTLRFGFVFWGWCIVFCGFS